MHARYAWEFKRVSLLNTKTYMHYILKLESKVINLEKSFKFLIIIALVILVVGVGLTQYTEGAGNAKKISYNGVVLTSNNSTIYVDLGELEKGTRIRVSWMADPTVGFMLFKTGTKDVIPTADNPRSPHLSDLNVVVFWGKEACFYEIPDLDMYSMSIFIPEPGVYPSQTIEEPIGEIFISYMSIDVEPPVTYPYANLGLGLAIIGILLIIITPVLSRMKKD